MAESLDEDLRRISQEAFELKIVRHAEGVCMHECSENKLKICNVTTDELPAKLKESPFCEEAVEDDEFVRYNTGLQRCKKYF